MQSHHHTQAYFCMVVRGPLHERRGSNQACFESGSVHFHPAHDPHSGRTSAAGAVCLSIVPKGSIAERIAGEREETPRIGPSHFMTRLAARCHLAFHEDDDASVLCVEAAALELTAGLLRHGVAVAPRHRPRWLDSVREHLDLHFTGRVTLRDLAALAGVHEVHVVRAFRRHEGLTPGAYLRRRRIEAARVALVSSSAPIADLGLEAGFSSQAHFTRLFHREVGLPPAAYRRRYGRLPG